MVVSIYLQSPGQAVQYQYWRHYGYAFLYGFLFALLAYNLMLFAGLRESRYLLYSIYLGMFMLMNMAYTGHAYGWFWPQSPQWAQWLKPILMLLYVCSGLLFALDFLKVRWRFPPHSSRRHRLYLHRYRSPEPGWN